MAETEQKVEEKKEHPEIPSGQMEMHCLKCKKKHMMDVVYQAKDTKKGLKGTLKGKCPVCGMKILRLCKLREYKSE
jgi:hypothetical protein